MSTAVAPHWGRTGPRMSDEETELFYALQEAIFDGAISNAECPDMHRDRFTIFIEFDYELATITDPVAQTEVTVDYSEYNLDERAQEAKETLKSGNSDNVFRRGTKGVIGGAKPLRQTSDSITQLRTSFASAAQNSLPKILRKYPTKEARQTILRRHTYAESVHQKIGADLQGKIQEVEGELKRLKDLPTQLDPAQLRTQSELRGQLNDLKALKKDFDEVDVYALTKALSYLPIGHVQPEVFNEIAENVRKEVTDEILAKTQADLRSKKSRWKPWQSVPQAELSKEDEKYIDDAVGLLYQDRAKYYEYHKNQRIGEDKAEGIEDLIIREAITFADAAEGDYSSDGWLDSGRYAAIYTEEAKDMFDHVFTAACDEANRNIVIPYESFLNIDVEYPADCTTDVQRSMHDQAIQQRFGTEIQTFRDLVFSGDDGSEDSYVTASENTYGDRSSETSSNRSGLHPREIDPAVRDAYARYQRRTQEDRRRHDEEREIAARQLQEENVERQTVRQFAVNALSGAVSNFVGDMLGTLKLVFG